MQKIRYEQKLKRLEQLARLLDNQFTIGGMSFGIEPLMGLIPGIGDMAGLLISGYLWLSAVEMGVPRSKLAGLAVLLLIDFAIGAIPVIGDLADVLLKVNVRIYQ